MSTDVVMPQMGESIAEGTITTWFKKVGDYVEKDEPLFEISTDKVDAEIPSPASGYLSVVLHQEMETVEVDKVVARITAEKGAAVEAKVETPAPSKAPTPAVAAAVGAAAPAAGRSQVAGVEELRRTRSSPLVRKIAAEHGVEITQLVGTGISGRVTKSDILAHLENRDSSRPAAATPARSAAPNRFAYQVKPGDKVEAFSAMRSQISDHMVISRETSVHVTTVFEVDMSRVAKLRAQHKESYAARGVNLTYTPFIMKAVIDALREFPVLNSSVADQQVVYHPNINLGMAVALDWGLLVPVIQNADEKSLLGLCRSVNDLAERARSKKLSPAEVQGGTFTITNPGIFGSLFGTPIINQPQVAILGVGTIAKRAVVTEDDAIAIRHMVYLALSFDHRIIDGATADRFMSRIKSALENFAEGSL